VKSVAVWGLCASHPPLPFEAAAVENKLWTLDSDCLSWLQLG